MNKNQRIVRLLLLLFIAITFKNVSAQQGCDQAAIRAAFTAAGCTELPSCNSSCSMYFYNPSSLSGSAAQNFAENLGANLISIQNGSENTCIANALASNGFGGVIWIGFNDEAQEGNFVWYDGRPVTYTNWASGEPNNSGGNEDCVQIFPDGMWNDLNCNGYNSKSVIEVNMCPQMTASSDVTICSGSSTVLTAGNTQFGSPPYTYTWSDGQSGQSITVSPTTTTTYTVTSTDRYGCYVTDDVVVTVVDATSNFAATPISSYCLYDSVQFVSSSSVSSPDAIANYGWDFGDGVQVTGNSVYHKYTSPGTYTVTHGITTANGCNAVSMQTITIFGVPTAQYTIADACPLSPVVFNDNSTASGGAISSWQWDFGDGTTGTNQNETHPYSTGGNYTTELIVVDANGCSDTLQQPITIYERPVSSFTFTDVCQGDTVHFVDNSTIPTPGNIVGWAWDIDNDENIDYTTQNANHLYPTYGDFDVTLEVLSNNGCTSSSTQTVSVHPLPIVSFAASTECVNEGPTRFVNTSTIPSGTTVLYGWSFGDGNVSTQENPLNQYQIASSYPVTLRVVSDFGCVDSVTFSVDVLGKPTAQFAQDTTGGCPVLCVQFTDQSFDDVPLNYWSWSFENGYGESIEQHPEHCFATTGTYDVSLIVGNNQGCKDTITKTALITVFPLPVSDFSLSPTSTDVLNPLIDFTNNSTDASAWEWNFDDGETDIVNYDVSHPYADSGHFNVQLVVFNSFLCSDTSYQEVEILPIDELFVPSAFSPNGDGKNDVLYARGYIDDMLFVVYDRLGRKVFESTDKTIGWDGLIKGKKALEGVYSWYLQAEVNGKSKRLKGDVTLVR